MTKLICPACCLTTFGTVTPQESDVLKHVREVHKKSVTLCNERRYRMRQDKKWKDLMTRNEEMFNMELEKRQREWKAFAEDVSSKEVPVEQALDDLHAERMILMEVDEDEYGQVGDDDGGISGERAQEANEQFGAGPAYVRSLRYHQNFQTRELAAERMAAFARAVPKTPLGDFLHGLHDLRSLQIDSFLRNFPAPASAYDGPSSDSFSGARRVRVGGQVSITAPLNRQRRTQVEDSEDEGEVDSDYVIDEEEEGED